MISRSLFEAQVILDTVSALFWDCVAYVDAAVMCYQRSFLATFLFKPAATAFIYELGR